MIGSWLDSLYDWLAREERYPPSPRLASANVFADKALEYRIGQNVAGLLPSKHIIELPYDAAKRDWPPGWNWGPLILYMNALDEEYSSAVYGKARRYGPYDPDQSGTAEEWDEGKMLIPSPQFSRMLADQLVRARQLRVDAVEIDNLDSYTLEQCLHIFKLVGGELGIAVKNPGMVEGDHAQLLLHPAAIGCIVEADCGNAKQMQALRLAAEKPQLPVWFVANRGERGWAEERVTEIRLADYKQMSVSWSPGEEDYSGSRILLEPKA